MIVSPSLSFSRCFFPLPLAVSFRPPNRSRSLALSLCPTLLLQKSKPVVSTAAKNRTAAQSASALDSPTTGTDEAGVAAAPLRKSRRLNGETIDPDNGLLALPGTWLSCLTHVPKDRGEDLGQPRAVLVGGARLVFMLIFCRRTPSSACAIAVPVDTNLGQLNALRKVLAPLEDRPAPRYNVVNRDALQLASMNPKVRGSTVVATAFSARSVDSSSRQLRATFDLERRRR